MPIKQLPNKGHQSINVYQLAKLDIMRMRMHLVYRSLLKNGHQLVKLDLMRMRMPLV